MVRDYQGYKSEEQLRSKVRCTLIVRYWDSAAEAEIVRREDDATRFGARSPEGFSSRFRGSWRHYLPIFSSISMEGGERPEADQTSALSDDPSKPPRSTPRRILLLRFGFGSSSVPNVHLLLSPSSIQTLPYLREYSPGAVDFSRSSQEVY